MPNANTHLMGLANAGREDCKTVEIFMQKKVRPNVRRFSDDGNAEHTTVHACFLRALSWLGTYQKLDDPRYFQAIVAGTRSLFEMCVDMAFFVDDRLTNPPSKLWAWERSSKLHGAERALEFLDKAKKPAAAGDMRFAERYRDEILALRRKWWGRDGHPYHWTGARNLREAAEAADKLGSYDFEEFYSVRFAQLCWSTHGTGATSVRGVDEENFPTESALAFHDSARFGTTIAKLRMEEFAQGDGGRRVIYRYNGPEGAGTFVSDHRPGTTTPGTRWRHGGAPRDPAAGWRP